MAKKREVRDDKGRFIKGGDLPKSPGRPRATKDFKTAHRKAIDIVEKYLSKADAVIDAALTPAGEVIMADANGQPLQKKNGDYYTMQLQPDPKVAMWLIDRLIPKDDSSLPASMNVDLSDMAGVIDAGQTTVEWVANRQLTIEKGSKMLTLLLTYAQMRAFDHINELKHLIGEFEQQSAGAVAGLDQKLVPQWGRLAEMTPINDTPAE